jgi:hypothetical protein
MMKGPYMFGGASTSLSTAEGQGEGRFALGEPVRPFSYPVQVSK